MPRIRTAPERIFCLENFVRALDLIARVLKRAVWISAGQRRLPTPGPNSKVMCREIGFDNIERTIDILTLGFGRDRSRNYWRDALARLSQMPSLSGYPKFGYLLEDNGVAVGVILLIFSARISDGRRFVRCNGSSLYVAPAYRSYAAILIRMCLRFKDVTYLNITPSPNTYKMIEAQGYQRFSAGQYICLPWLCKEKNNSVSEKATPANYSELKDFEVQILCDHVNYGCNAMALVCRLGNKTYPFLFALRRKFLVPLAHLIYCRNQEEFPVFARALGRVLSRHGYPLVVLDANGIVPCLPGRYLDLRPKFSSGPEQMRLGDLPYTERVIFGY
jgi:hypothetical protein